MHSLTINPHRQSVHNVKKYYLLTLWRRRTPSYIFFNSGIIHANNKKNLLNDNIYWFSQPVLGMNFLLSIDLKENE